MSKLKKILLGSSVLALVVMFVVVFLVFTHLNAPSSATFSSGKGANDQGVYQVNLTPKLKVGKYVSFKYPQGLNPYPGQIGGSQIEIYNFTTQDVETWLLGVEISKLKVSNLDLSSDYTYRKNNPTIYSESHVMINGNYADVMTDKTASGFNEVGFILNGNELATVSLIGDDAQGLKPLQTTFNMVIGSLHWL